MTNDQSIQRTIKINQKISTSDDIVVSSKIIEKFIDEANYLWIMNFCLCREANNCQNYPKELGCLFLGEAVQKIDPDFGRLVTKEEAKEHIKNCADSGLVHLIGRNKLDTQWLDVRPGNKLLTICSCCECCCLWKMLPNLPTKISRNIMKMPGVKVEILNNCTKCGICIENTCFVNAISMGEEHAEINQETCRGCARCVERCPEQAIQLIIEDNNFLEETLKRISEAVSVK